jgi:DNA-damage-inducible protein J
MSTKEGVAMSQINVNIRMDEALKRDFEAVCGEMGLTMTTAFTVFAKAVSSRKEIPFKVTAQPMTNDITYAGLEYPAKEYTPAESAPGTYLSVKTPRPGCMKGQIWMADDFDAPLDDFKEYME